MKIFKKIIWVIIGLISMSIVYFVFLKRENKNVEVSFDTIARESIKKKVTATGTIKPILNVEVGTQVSGRISKLFVDFNDRVKTGQIIAKMDTRNLIALVKESEASLTITETQLNQSKRNLDRSSELYSGSAIAKIDLEKAEDEYQKALASFNSVKLQLERNLINLDYATIKSPIDGIIISRKVDEGQTVAAVFSTPTFYTIANDLKKMKIDASVDEADIGEVKKGQLVEFTVDAFPDQLFTGKVNQVQLQPTTIQSVVTYIVEITFENKEMKLMPGMTANLEIIVEKKSNILTVPNGTLGFSMNEKLINSLKKEGFKVTNMKHPEQKTIWIQKDNIFIQKKIKTGYSNGIKTEIKGEFLEGDKIINSVEIVEKNNKKSGSFLMPQNQNKKDK